MLKPCDYACNAQHRRRRRWPMWLSIGIVISLGLLVLPMVPIRQVESHMDPVTGSMCWKTVWFSGLTLGPTVDISPLEKRLRSEGVPWTASWQFLHKTHRNIFGRAICHECGSAPAIYQIRPMLDAFAEASTDAELREFVRVMQLGTEAEQKAAVEATAEKSMGCPGVGRTTGN